MKYKSLIALTVTTALGMGSNFASAALLTCTDDRAEIDRTWTFNSADACDTGPGNPNSSADIEALGGAFNLGALNWSSDNGISAPGADTSPWLNVSLSTGTWGGTNVTGTWTLAAGFWDTFTDAVFTVHVGGNPDTIPDDFGAFLITPDQYSGTWSFVQVPGTGGGGGLSNVRLWYVNDGGSEEENPSGVPEPGILLLFGTALMGLGLSRKRKAKA